jgi:tetratricopeptide (TPR) repeat protein
MGYSVDVRGERLNTSSAAAVAAFDRGITSFATWRTDTFDHLDAASNEDPNFAMPKLAKAWVLQTARSEKFRPMIEAVLRECAPLLSSDDTRERAYFDGLTHAVNGRGIEAGTALESMLVNHPLDLFAHRLVQFELFWNGRAGWMRDIAERAAPAWDADVPGYGNFLSVRAFSNEECGLYETAERCGREAVTIDPGDCWGTHAVAHVLVMQGRIEEGVDWLEGLSPNWGQANQMRHHLWWHLCLFLLERGETERCLDLLVSQIRNPDSPLVQAVPDATIDIQNVASLLLRLELRGVDVSEHWPMLVDVCAGRIHNHANAFSNAHDMMVLAANGRFDDAEALLQSIRENGQSDDTSLSMSYRMAGTALCEAVLAHRRGEYERVVALIAPVRHDLPLVGGSHAQRDIFYQLLVDATARLGRTDEFPVYVADIERIGFSQVRERTFYRDALAH